MWRTTWLVFSQAVTVAVAVLFVVMTLKPDWLPRSTMGLSGRLPAPTLIQAAPRPVPAAASADGGDAGYAAAAKRAAPAVASIVASSSVAANPHANDPAFRFFFGDDETTPRAGMGSAVIVSAEGYLLTNHHVVAGADDIEVQLADGRQASARLVGSDPETDLAVLKIDLDRLPVMVFGDIASLDVGDAVLAIGNPFGVGQTVTSGIVSALGRNQLGLSTFENFIQTDAAINPGNSGGALVDAEGHLVGINTAIFSRSGGNMGIGFAIPVDTAQQVLQSLVRDGRVTRGWIGVETRELSADLAESFGLPVREGVLVTGVLQDGPASKGGMRPGDVVVRVGEQAVKNPAQLLAAVAALTPQAAAEIGVQRGPQALALSVTVAERPPMRQRRGPGPR
jgi:Do/DeqQ family serine protease